MSSIEKKQHPDGFTNREKRVYFHYSHVSYLLFRVSNYSFRFNGESSLSDDQRGLYVLIGSVLG